MTLGIKILYKAMFTIINTYSAGLLLGCKSVGSQGHHQIFKGSLDTIKGSLKTTSHNKNNKTNVALALQLCIWQLCFFAPVEVKSLK